MLFLTAHPSFTLASGHSYDLANCMHVMQTFEINVCLCRGDGWRGRGQTTAPSPSTRWCTGALTGPAGA